MKTCSDCLYYEVCQNRYSWLDQEDNTKYITCEKFKNKADFVEVVRCRKCANRNKFKCPNRHFSDISGEAEDYTEDNDFCSYGERSDTNG